MFAGGASTLANEGANAMITKSRAYLCFALLLWACIARAEFGAPYITPPHPIPGEAISLNIYQGGCDGITGPGNPEVTVDGTFIYVLAQGVRIADTEWCFLGYGIATFAIGSYPAGNYTLQLDLRYPNIGGDFVIETLGVVPFVVGGAPAVAVQTSGTFWLPMLAALICLASARRMLRR